MLNWSALRKPGALTIAFAPACTAHHGFRNEEPWLVILAASEAISGAAEQLDHIHSLGIANGRKEIDLAMRHALEDHVRYRIAPTPSERD